MSTCTCMPAHRHAHAPAWSLSPAVAREFWPREGSILLHKTRGHGRPKWKCNFVSVLGDPTGTVGHPPAPRTGAPQPQRYNPSASSATWLQGDLAEEEVSTRRAGPTWRPQSPTPASCLLLSSPHQRPALHGPSPSLLTSQPCGPALRRPAPSAASSVYFLPGLWPARGRASWPGSLHLLALQSSILHTAAGMLF